MYKWVNWILDLGVTPVWMRNDEQTKFVFWGLLIYSLSGVKKIHWGFMYSAIHLQSEQTPSVSCFTLLRGNIQLWMLWDFTKSRRSDFSLLERAFTSGLLTKYLRKTPLVLPRIYYLSESENFHWFKFHLAGDPVYELCLFVFFVFLEQHFLFDTGVVVTSKNKQP